MRIFFKKMAKIINLNILNVKKGIVCHQVNCMGKMGAGIALAIRKKWPICYEEYKDLYRLNLLQLGKVFPSKVDNDLFIAHCCGQYYYGRKGKFTNYLALKECFKTVEQFSKEMELKVFLPYKIGCSLAGGDWNIVKGLIDEFLPNSVICKHKK